MNKIITPFFFIGIGLVIVGTALNGFLRDWEHNWISIPISIVGIILLIVNIVSVVKSKKD
jgi:hypothetical protein